MRTQKRITAESNGQTAYDRDYWSWAMDQARALRAGRIADLDLPHLAEEVADLGKSEERRLESELARLLEHLLKLRHASERLRQENARGWRISVRSARRKARKVVAENPGLKTKMKEILADAYQDARDAVLVELDLPESDIAQACRWSFEQLLAEDFRPD